MMPDMPYAHAVPDPLERVTNLLALLLESRTSLTLQQISDQLVDWYAGNPTAVRAAFERDKAMLRDIGVPIETEVLGGDQAGQTAYRLDRDRYELRGLDLAEDERHALQLAVAAVRSDVGQEGVWKLGGSVGSTAPVRADLPAMAALPVLRSASSQHVAVELTYHGTVRRLDPYGLLLRNGFWYVIGFDHVRGEVRTFRVDRIDGDVQVLDGVLFERPAGFDPGAAFPDDPKALGDRGEHAVVLIDAVIAPALERELGAAAVLGRRADGGIEMVVPCSNIDAFRSWVIGLGTHAEVIGPADVRAAVVSWLRLIADRVPA
jgi:proteasome accessory factor B